MLKNLADGTLPSKFIMIDDSNFLRGRVLNCFFTNHHANRSQNKLHILTYAAESEDTNDRSSRVQYHDCYTNSKDWDNDVGENYLAKCTLLETVSKVIGEDAGDFVLVIDELAILILNHGVAQCYKDLHSLISKDVIPGTRAKQVICRFTRDLLANRDTVITKFQRLATTYLKLEDLSESDKYFSVVNITHKKPGGKVIRKFEEFCIDSTGHLQYYEVQRSLKAEHFVNQPIDMESLTTFRLGLTDEEKEARSKVVLPFTLRTDGSSAGEGRIFYDPDAADDWDEEDPDED